MALRSHIALRSAQPPARTRAWRLGLRGALIGLSAPLGWLVLQAMRGTSFAAVFVADPLLIAYLLIGATGTLAVFGWVLGAKEDRLIALNRRLDRLSITDPLTGLHNRRYFMQRLDQAIALLDRADEPLALAIVDLDRFKRVNDRHGHQVGDETLHAAAAAMAQVIRRGEVVARIGGEEFGVLLPRTDIQGARQVAERLRQAVSGTMVSTPSGTVRLTASVGAVVAWPNDEPSAGELLRAADRALYACKRAGRNRASVRTFGGSLRALPDSA